PLTFHFLFLLCAPPSFSLSSTAPVPPRHPFPTRRSSDLVERRVCGHAEKAPQAPGVDQRIVFQGVELLLRQVFKAAMGPAPCLADRKSTRLNSSHVSISYAVFCLKKKTTHKEPVTRKCR